MTYINGEEWKMKKIQVAVLFGGQSSEHEVSCMSAINVIEQINRDDYDVTLIGITKQGRWLYIDTIEEIRSGEWENGAIEAILTPNAIRKSILIHEKDQMQEIPVDVVFPVLHGKYGEDGTVQGLLELAGIPYVGCGVLSSAISMDKRYTKIVVEDLGITQADYIAVMSWEMREGMESILDAVEKKFSYPVFVKPSNAGSSKGVTKAANRNELADGLQEAARHDRKILVEETIVGREIECAVFGGGQKPVLSSCIGEILAAADFYDFEAKYFNADSKTVIDPQLPAGIAEEVRKASEKIFNAVDGFGLARVDFFLKEDKTIVFNEINTLPGFTAISMYPMLWEASGMKKDELIHRLIQMAFERI